MTNTVKPHGYTTKAIHWISAGLIIYGYSKGLDNVSDLADPAVLRFEVGFAILLGAVFAFRWFWTKSIAGASRLPMTAPNWEKFASKAVHLGLYASVFGIILSGFGIAIGYATPVLDGAFLFAMTEIHEFTLVALPALLATHIAGALWHKFIRQDGILESMTGKLPL